MQVSSASVHFRVPPIFLTATPSFCRSRRPRIRCALSKVQVLNLDAHDGVLQVYQEEVEASPEKVVVLDSAAFNRLFIEVSFAKEKVKDVINLANHGEQQLEELMNFHSGVMELKNLRKSRQISSSLSSSNKPQLTINKRMTWKDSFQSVDDLIETTREGTFKQRRAAKVQPNEDSFSELLKNPLINNRDSRLLTAKEEAMLSRKVQFYLKVEEVKAKFKHVHNREAAWEELSPLLMVDTCELRNRYHDGARAKHIMVERNMRMVIGLAAKLLKPGAELLDSIVDGVFGLIRAIEKFDPDKGFKLSTYAHWWIRQSIVRTMAQNAHVIRVPSNVSELYRRMQRKIEEHVQIHGSIPGDDILAEQLKITPKRLQTVKNAYWHTVRIEAPGRSSSDTGTLEDAIKDDNVLSSEEHYLVYTMKEDLELVLSTLPERESAILRLRYGLEDGKHRTLDKIGGSFEVTRERIRQIEARALRKLQERSSTLEEYVEPLIKSLPSTTAAAYLKAE